MNAVRAMVGCSLMMLSMTSGPVVQMAQAADKVIAGSLGGQAPLWAIYVAVHKSFFAREGIDLELNSAQSGAAVTQQLTAASLDVALSVGITDPIRAIDKGASLALIRVIGNAAPYVLIGKPGFKSIADLKGKIISVGADNDITTVFFERMMSANGLKKSDYDVVPAGVAAARFAALKAGVVDAAIVLPPLNFQATASGFVTLGLAADYVKDFLHRHGGPSALGDREFAGRQTDPHGHGQKHRLARGPVTSRRSDRASGQGRPFEQRRRRGQLRLSSPDRIFRAQQQGLAREIAQPGCDGAARRDRQSCVRHRSSGHARPH